MSNQFWSVLTAFAGSSLLNLGQGFQKWGLSFPKEKPVKRWAIWGIGLPMMVGATFLLQHATSLGGASLVGSMFGTGLAALTLFSIFVMKEKSGIGEIVGVGIILGSSILIGAFSGDAGTESVINFMSLYIYCGAIVATLVLTSLIFRNKTAIMGILLGSLAGGLGGFVTLFQKVTTSNTIGAVSVFANPFFYVWVALSFISFGVLQLAYGKGKAIHILPAFSASAIVVPIIGGVVCFSETLNLFQWAGAAGTLAGVILISMISVKGAGKEEHK
jgi:drug/metabolite transporter (DMT)-like permease